MEPDNPPEGTHLERGREFGRGDAVFSDLPHGSTLEAVRIGLWEADPITREAWCSPAHGAIFGYSPDQVGDWSIEAFWNHVHPEDRGRVDQSIQEGIRNGTGCEFECRIL
ncbi:MAG: PAS domain-containing protein, partial [Verrucomicrobiales bacterium]|nr:PAS domain-containing protein [Verrucomicrobiales bacterium]